MNKKTFIKELREELKSLPKEEQEDIIADYEEHFYMGKKKKRTEQNIAKKLGKPKDLAKQLKAAYAIKKVEEKSNTKNLLRAILASIGLGFLNIIIVLGPFIALFATIISLFATGIAITATGLALSIASIIPTLLSFLPIPLTIGTFFIGIGLFSLGLLFTIGTYYLGKVFTKLTIKYLKFSIKIIKGKEE